MIAAEAEYLVCQLLMCDISIQTQASKTLNGLDIVCVYFMQKKDSVKCVVKSIWFANFVQQH